MPDYAPLTEIRLFYNNRNITADVANALLSFTYADKVKGESDELQVVLEDVQGLWSDLWYPEKGATLTAEISHNGNILRCGSFSIDEIELSGPPDTVNIRSLAAFTTKKTRTRHSTAHENKTLVEIARTVASKHGYKVAGNIPDIRINRITQHRETDLHFLNTLATQYGLVFSIRDKVLTFTSIYDIEGRHEVILIDKTQVASFSIKDKTSDTYKSVHLSYHNPVTDELVSHTQAATQEDIKEDSLELRITAENRQQAELKTMAAIHNSNTRATEGTIKLPGNLLLVSGNNFRLTGFGSINGLYHILESTHSIDPNGGYTTDVQVKRIGR